MFYSRLLRSYVGKCWERVDIVLAANSLGLLSCRAVAPFSVLNSYYEMQGALSSKRNAHWKALLTPVQSSQSEFEK